MRADRLFNVIEAFGFFAARQWFDVDPLRDTLERDPCKSGNHIIDFGGSGRFHAQPTMPWTANQQDANRARIDVGRASRHHLPTDGMLLE